jgi:hypothetical protein
MKARIVAAAGLNVAISVRMRSCQGWDRSLPRRGVRAATLILDRLDHLE